MIMKNTMSEPVSRCTKHPMTAIPSRFALLRYPSGFLLVAQLISLILYAAFEGLPMGRVFLGSFGILIVLLVVWVIVRSPALSWIGWTLAAPALMLSLSSWLFTSPTLSTLAALFEAVLYFYGAAGLISYMMGDDRVTVDELFAAGATFTLIAWGFAYLYLVCQAWSSGSFIGGAQAEGQRTFIELLFLSFTNLSATGLSDIVPISSPARVLVMLEQFAGIGYLAVVVSRLIGMSITRDNRRA